MKTLGLQTNFTAGAFSPLLGARVDFAKYKNSVQTAENVFVESHGPLLRRTGFRYVANSISNSINSRLIPFRVRNGDSVIMELSNYVMRFYQFDGLNPGVITDGIDTIELVTPWTAAEAKELQYVQIGTTMYFAHPNYMPRVLTRLAIDDWTIEEVDFAPPPVKELGRNGAADLTLDATTGAAITCTAASAVFLAADLGRQIIHDTNVGVCVITGYTSTTVVTVDILEDFPSTTVLSGEWTLDLSPLTTLTPGAVALGASCTLTLSAAGWRSNNVGEYVLVNDGVVKITTYTSTTVVRGTILKELSASTATTNWSLEQVTWNAERGYPRAVGLYQQRLWFSSTVAEPEGLWGSKTGVYSNFGRGADDDAGLSFSLTLGDSSQINALASGRELIILGNATESTISAGTNAITPTNVQEQVRSFYGSKARAIALIDTDVVFIQEAGTKIRAMRYDFQLDGYVSPEISYLSDHYLIDGIDQLAYARNPYSMLFATTDEGELLSCAVNKDQQVSGWTRFNTDGTILSIAISENNSVSNLWLVVRRNINGSFVNYIEVYSPTTVNSDLNGYMDSFLFYSVPLTITDITTNNPGVVTSAAHGLVNGNTVIIKNVAGMTELNGGTYTVANKTADTFELSGIDTSEYSEYISGGYCYKKVSTISGLDHLEGETVAVLADGAVLTNEVVASGAVTLQYAAGEVILGLPYTSTVVTQRLEAQAVGQNQGANQRWINPIIRVYNSSIPTVNDYPVPIRTPQMNMDAHPDYFTGDLMYGAMSFDTTGQLTITMSDPTPLTLVGIFGTIETNTK